jgi:hypothetical protein
MNNATRLAGVVMYKAGELPFFEKDTVVQPDNQFPIPHFELIRQAVSHDAEVLGVLPSNFPEMLVNAVRASVTMSPREKQRILEMLVS